MDSRNGRRENAHRKVWVDKMKASDFPEYWVEAGYCVVNDEGNVTSYFKTKEEAERECQDYIKAFNLANRAGEDK
jgi:hypothetical protein